VLQLVARGLLFEVPRGHGLQVSELSSLRSRNIPGPQLMVGRRVGRRVGRATGTVVGAGERKNGKRVGRLSGNPGFGVVEGTRLWASKGAVEGLLDVLGDIEVEGCDVGVGNGPLVGRADGKREEDRILALEGLGLGKGDGRGEGGVVGVEEVGATVGWEDGLRDGTAVFFMQSRMHALMSASAGVVG